ncbi:hypothetical protein [Neobacillus mesonae]|uniref:hypothetical protein n=1 Tax=Neobacillus mesonae TaxID=1193713 RepID=UPI00203CD29B|nr:hypothetical protein [Neobacillus mesonae]MCM3570136.1 hypothetical protein [Neobacillus mesonae]
MKKKMITCSFIFLFIFSAAFLLQQKNQLEFFEKQMDSTIENVNILPLGTQVDQVQRRMVEKFRPREYVRIAESL